MSIKHRFIVYGFLNVLFIDRSIEIRSKKPLENLNFTRGPFEFFSCVGIIDGSKI